MAVLLSTVASSKVKSMDAIILFDYKNYLYSCADFSWSGDENELDVVTKIQCHKVCCPICKSDDVSVLVENKKD